MTLGIRTAYRPLSMLDIGRPPPIKHDDAEQLVGIIRKPAAVLFPQPLNDVPAQHPRSPSYSHAVAETPSQRMPDVGRHLKIFVQLIDPEGEWHVESSLR